MSCGFFFLSFYLSFFSSPNLSGRRLDVYCTSTHGVAVEMCCMQLTGNAGCKKSPFWHHRPTLSGYIFRTIGKTLLNSNTSFTCPDDMVNFGLLTAEIVSGVWGTPATSNGFRVLAALLHSTLAVGVSQTLRLYSAGRPSRWALAHISS